MSKRVDDRLHAMRRQLAAAIVQALRPDSQHAISRSLGIPQPRMSELNRGVVVRCTIDWLIDRVHRLGGTVTLTVAVPDARRAWQTARFAAMRARRQNGTAALRAPGRDAATSADSLVVLGGGDSLIPNLE
jgi:predicted XRE-type DNA-binding protein